MEPIDITRYPLPTSILKSLLTLVEIAERNQVMSRLLQRHKVSIGHLQ